jgi:hypothetical protein
MLDMNAALYKKCSGWAETLPIRKKLDRDRKLNLDHVKKLRLKVGAIQEEDMLPKFQRFLLRGGHISIWTGEIIL